MFYVCMLSVMCKLFNEKVCLEESILNLKFVLKEWEENSVWTFV